MEEVFMANNELQIAGSQGELRIRPYEHHAKYYETDQMGIIHHSNYVKWMEEARLIDGSDRAQLQADGGYGNHKSGAVDIGRVSQYGTFR